MIKKILTGIIMAALGFGAIILINRIDHNVPATQLQPAETTGWKQYEDESNAFSIKYPADWIVKGEEELEKNELVLFSGIVNNTQFFTVFGAETTPFNSTAELKQGLQDNYQQIPGAPALNDDDFAVFKTDQGLSGLQYTVADTASTNFIVFNNGTRYGIDITGEHDNEAELLYAIMKSLTIHDL